MIVDILDNISIYRGFSEHMFLGLNFILEAKPTIEKGIYKLNSHVSAIISEYDTIKNFSRGYESHKKVIDIQYPIIGLERIKWSPIKDMEINIPYDSIKDRTFYKNPSKQSTYIDIGNGIFAIMFPNDGHSPQHYVDKSQKIKKITIKVSI